MVTCFCRGIEESNLIGEETGNMITCTDTLRVEVICLLRGRELF